MNKQHNRIEQYIKENGSITGKEAHKYLGIESFTKRISEMRKKGYPLTSQWESGRNKYNERVRYKRWYLGESKNGRMDKTTS